MGLTTDEFEILMASDLRDDETVPLGDALHVLAVDTEGDSVEDTQRSGTAIALRNEADDVSVSVRSLMELRRVLAKKTLFDRDRIDRIERRITARTTVTIPDASDMLTANRIQSDTLLYPMDAMILAAAEAIDATVVTFDTELLDHGAVHPDDVR